MTTRSPIPAPALWLGLAGWLPFWAPVVLMVHAVLTQRSAAAETALFIIYAAIILGFLGGVRWGRALAPDGSPTARLLALSVLPSILGLAAAFVYWTGAPLIALGLILAGLVLHWRWDLAAVGAGRLPGWYGTLRSLLTLGAALAAMAMLALYPMTPH